MAWTIDQWRTWRGDYGALQKQVEKLGGKWRGIINGKPIVEGLDCEVEDVLAGKKPTAPKKRKPATRKVATRKRATRKKKKED